VEKQASPRAGIEFDNNKFLLQVAQQLDHVAEIFNRMGLIVFTTCQAGLPQSAESLCGKNGDETTTSRSPLNAGLSPIRVSNGLPRNETAGEDEDRHGFASANNQRQTHMKSETVRIIQNNYRDLRTHDSKMIVGTNLKAPITSRPKSMPL